MVATSGVLNVLDSSPEEPILNACPSGAQHCSSSFSEQDFHNFFDTKEDQMATKTKMIVIGPIFPQDSVFSL